MDSFFLVGYSRKKILSILSGIGGRKCLVIDSTLVGFLNQFIDYPSLKDIGIDKLVLMEEQIPIVQTDNVIYICRPDIYLMKTVIKQQCDTYVLFIPRSCQMCQELLEPNIGILTCETYFIPYSFDKNILSYGYFHKLMKWDGDIKYIEELINRGKPYYTILRLLCLYSLSVGEVDLEHFKTKIAQSYGYEQLFLLDELERMGIIRRKRSDGLME